SRACLNVRVIFSSPSMSMATTAMLFSCSNACSCLLEGVAQVLVAAFEQPARRLGAIGPGGEQNSDLHRAIRLVQQTPGIFHIRVRDDRHDAARTVAELVVVRPQIDHEAVMDVPEM